MDRAAHGDGKGTIGLLAGGWAMRDRGKMEDDLGLDPCEVRCHVLLICDVESDLARFRRRSARSHERPRLVPRVLQVPHEPGSDETVGTRDRDLHVPVGMGLRADAVPSRTACSCRSMSAWTINSMSVEKSVLGFHPSSRRARDASPTSASTSAGLTNLGSTTTNSR